MGEAMVNAPAVAKILGGSSVLHRRVKSLADLRLVVEHGLPVDALERTVAHFALEPGMASELKHGIVPKTTLQRRTRLTLEESERLERLARLAALAEEVWESPSLAKEFLVTAQPQLDGERPIDLARTDLGARQVEQLLMRIEHALPS
jgi:putative toxin-antitoxin system antitoxin component (TIGR02293 family)